MKYTLKLNGSITLEQDNGDVLHIPADPENRDYKKYLEWLNAGNVAEIETPTVVEKIATKTSARRDAEQHILNYFSTLELMDMLKRLNSAPNERLVAINTWIELIQAEAITNWQNPNFLTHGAPAYTYEETL